MWDTKIDTYENEHKQFTMKALNGTLTIPEAQMLSLVLKNEPEYAFEIGLTPTEFPALVQHSADIALSLLIGLQGKDKSREFYAELLKMPLTNELASFIVKVQESVKFPEHYYDAFINNGIENCMKENANEKQEDVKKKQGQAKLLALIISKYSDKNNGILLDVHGETISKVFFKISNKLIAKFILYRILSSA